MTPYFTDGQRTIYHGDAWALATELPAASVDCIITSPPYWGLRDYKTPGQFGLEKHPQEWIERLVDLFLRLRPALKPTATIWVNLGDTYFSQGGSRRDGDDASQRGLGLARGAGLFRQGRQADGFWLRPKQLLLLPSRCAIAMQDAGFLLRNDMIWHKRNAMPSPVRDRLSCTYEHVFLFALQERYYFDLEAVREPHAPQSIKRGKYGYEPVKGDEASHYGKGFMRNDGQPVIWNPSGRHPGDVREWATQPFPELHFATFPEALPDFCLRAGCPTEVCEQCGKAKVRHLKSIPNPAGIMGLHNMRHAQDFNPEAKGKHLEPANRETLGWSPTCSCSAPFVPGLVLDPFLGSGTVLAVAKRRGLRGIGFELSPDYCAMAVRRIEAAGKAPEFVAAERAGQAVLPLGEALEEA